MIKIAPSILSADLADLAGEISRIESADFVHVDVMDGSYVPNITFGQGMVKTLSRLTDKPLDVHLMIERPEHHLESFMEAGASIITVHPDATRHLHRQLGRIKELGGLAGVALNPSDPSVMIENVLDLADLVLIMTVNPGFGGQDFIEGQTTKIAEVAELVAASGRNIMIEVDGGVNSKTAEKVRRAGADVLVAGTYIFRAEDAEAAIRTLRG
ncbi:MAG: Ribulose-phosphate 3-epimerase [Firmicutes bacterium ADurb.Bin153]|nr:MAG: Ribulose-phosphate 3-epimerase [Firmicutes bacterium ADurb.Bin153]